MTSPCPATGHRVESFARVVRIDGARTWLEPEQTSACGHCAAAASCGAQGEAGSRIEKRRFALDIDERLSIGERVVVVVDERSLLKAALTAYMIPLVAALAAGGVAQSLWGSDIASLAAVGGGLLLGLMATRRVARRLSGRGELAPRFLRRAGEPAGSTPCTED